MSVPFYGKEFTLTQPDGTQIQVRGWGDQRHAVFETLDGYTVVQDPITGFYQYATATDDREELVPTGVRPGMAAPEGLGLTRGVRISAAAARAKGEMCSHLPPSKSRWEIRRERHLIQKRALAMMPAGVAPAPPKRQTVGDYVGLCLLIQFPDAPGTTPREEVEAFCNREGYNGFGNNGSVRDYFFDVSGGKLRYTNLVTPYYTAKHPRAYYTNESVPQPQRAYELIKEALDDLKTRGFDCSRLTVDDENYVYALNVYYAGPCVNNWAKGLWPHSFHLRTPFALAPGKQVFDYQMSNMGDQLTLGTFCHENGHMVCEFPDLYDYGYESFGVGTFCLMCGGANADERNPTQPCAYLKIHAGWAKAVTPITPGLRAEVPAGENCFFIREKSPTECFIIENRVKAGRDQAIPGSGLLIWHVDELGSNNNHQHTPRYHYECALVQADGCEHLEHMKNPGDARDLFQTGVNDRFSDTTKPNSLWWDGSPSGLNIHDISAAGKIMMFIA